MATSDDEPIPPADMRLREIQGPNCRVTQVGGTLDGKVLLTFRDEAGPAKITVFIDPASAKRLLTCIPRVLEALSGRLN